MMAASNIVASQKGKETYRRAKDGETTKAHIIFHIRKYKVPLKVFQAISRRPSEINWEIVVILMA